MAKTPTLEVHEIAQIYPDMTGDQEANFETDLVENGVIDPIIAIGDKIVDGKNRYRLAKKNGLPFDVVQFKGTLVQALALARSKNAERRHMTSSQRAASAVRELSLKNKYLKQSREVLAEDGGEPQSEVEPDDEPKGGDTAQRIADENDTNRQYVYKAMKIEEADPELLDKVTSGELTIPEAEKQLPNQPKPRASKNGAVKFDDRKIEAEYGKLVRMLDERRKSSGKSAEHDAAVARLNDSLAAFKRWQRETT